MHGLGFSLQNTSLPHPVCVSRTLCKPHMVMRGLKGSLKGVSYNVYQSLSTAKYIQQRDTTSLILLYTNGERIDFTLLKIGNRDLIQDPQSSAVSMHRTDLEENFLIFPTVWICIQESYNLQNFKVKLSIVYIMTLSNPFKTPV